MALKEVAGFVWDKLAGTLKEVIQDLQQNYSNYKEYLDIKVDLVVLHSDLVVKLTGKKNELTNQFPTELVPYLNRAYHSLVKLDNLIQEAIGLQNVTAKNIVQKIVSGGDFKRNFDHELLALQSYYSQFFEEQKKSSSLPAWYRIFLYYPQGGLFWLQTSFSNENEVKYELFYAELRNACGGSRGEEQILSYPVLFLKVYVYEYICDEVKTDSVTVESFKQWLGKMIDGKKVLDEKKRDLRVKKLVKDGYDQLFTHPPDESPLRKLYSRATALFQKAVHPETVPLARSQLLTDSKGLFLEYRVFIKARETDPRLTALLRDPKEDRHLYYLSEIERRINPSPQGFTLHEFYTSWLAWTQKHGTPTPEQKAKATATKHYLDGERDLLDIKMQLGEIKEGDFALELQTFESLPPYMKKAMNNWKLDDILSYLKEEKLSDYEKEFVENRLDGSLFMTLTDEDLEKELKIEKRLIRQKIRNFITSFVPKQRPIDHTPKAHGEKKDLRDLVRSANTSFDAYRNILQDHKVKRVLDDKIEYYTKEIQRLEQVVEIFLRERIKSESSASSSSTSASSAST